jgi:hypothetical protein
MGKRLKLAAASLALLFTSVSGVAAISAPAFAVSCSGAGCIHKDPQASGCSSGATTLASVTPPGGGPVVTLRWSSACVANWTRFEDNTGGYSPGDWNYWVETSDGHREYQLFSNAYWTYMVNGNLAARACIQGVATTQYNCTAWF